MPSIKDPKLWQVRCKKNHERKATMALMQKMVSMTKRKKPLEILSATYVEHIQEYVFVEAFKLDDVRRAIKDLNYFFFKIDMV